MSSANLVERFAEIVVAQNQALLGGELAKFNRLFRQMMDIANELKAREGDQRRLLLELFTFPNMQVRVQVAKLTLAIAPSKHGNSLKQSRTRIGCLRPEMPACRFRFSTAVC
jgi:Domain of unknown function (DUF2019)